MSHHIINFDNQSTTQPDGRVVEAIIDFYRNGTYANPSSSHKLGQEARSVLQNSRKTIAKFINALPQEIYFAYSATQCANIIINGVAAKYQGQKTKIITSRLEHKATLNTVQNLETLGYTVEYIENDHLGNLNIEHFDSLLDDQVALVCVMHANNEIGTINNIQEISRICDVKNTPLLSDGAQAAGKFRINVKNLGVDFYTMSSHKMYAPYGTAIIYVKDQSRKHLRPVLFGAGQERGLIPGTENIRGIYAFAKACSILDEEIESSEKRISELRDTLLTQLNESEIVYTINGAIHNRLSGNINVRFDGVEAETLLNKLENFALSTGSACNSNYSEPSHVLLAIGCSAEQANESIRISIGKFNTSEEINLLAQSLISNVKRILKHKNYGVNR